MKANPKWNRERQRVRAMEEARGRMGVMELPRIRRCRDCRFALASLLAAAWLAAGTGWGVESVFDEGAVPSDVAAAPPETQGKPSVTVDTRQLRELWAWWGPEWERLPAVRLRVDLDGAEGVAPMETLRTLDRRIGAVEVETPVRGVWVGMEGDEDPEKPMRATFSVQREF